MHRGKKKKKIILIDTYSQNLIPTTIEKNTSHFSTKEDVIGNTQVLSSVLYISKNFFFRFIE